MSRDPALFRHEAGTALYGILGLTESLQEGTYGELSTAQASALVDIGTSARSLLAMIQSLTAGEQGARVAAPAVARSTVADTPIWGMRAVAELSPPPLVLVVDDDSVSRRVLRDSLQPLGITLVFAQDGREALELAEQFRPNLILLDAMMPELDGFQAVERLRQHPVLGDVPIIMLSAFSDRDNRLRGLRAGANDFVTKPFDRDELRARVITACSLDKARRLAASGARYEQWVAQSVDGILIVDPDGVITFCNEAARRLIAGLPQAGCSKTESPRHFLSCVSPSDRSHVATALSMLDETTQCTGRFDALLIGDGGTPVEITAICNAGGAGDIMLILRDMRPRREMEDALRRSRELEGVGQMAAGIAHDVAALLDAAEQQRSRPTSSEADEERASRSVARALARARTMVRSLLRYGREMVLEREPMVPADFLEEQRTFLEGLLPATIRLGVEVAVDTPPISAAPMLLERALLNLVFNARNALHGEGSITLSAAREGNGVLFAVTDDGPGLDAGIAARLSSPDANSSGDHSSGNSAQRARQSSNGSGLGLGIVRHAAAVHGGRFMAERTGATGTRMTLWLPAS